MTVLVGLGGVVEWRWAVLGLGLELTAAGLVAMYALMRGLTTSTELFEGVPTYVVGIHLVVSGGLLGLLSGTRRAGRSLVVRFAAAAVGIALVLSLVALAMSLSLYQRQASYALCLLRSLCLCRLDADSGAAHGWDAFHASRDCLFLPRLGRLVLATSVLHAAASLLSVAALAQLLLSPPPPPSPTDLPSDSPFHRHSSTASLRRFLSRFHLVVFPPSYDESREHPAPLTLPPSASAPPPYSPALSPNSSSIKSQPNNVTLLQLAA